jgi:hypothetical protein
VAAERNDHANPLCDSCLALTLRLDQDDLAEMGRLLGYSAALRRHPDRCQRCGRYLFTLPLAS